MYMYIYISERVAGGGRWRKWSSNVDYWIPFNYWIHPFHFPVSYLVAVIWSQSQSFLQALDRLKQKTHVKTHVCFTGSNLSTSFFCTWLLAPKTAIRCGWFVRSGFFLSLFQIGASFVLSTTRLVAPGPFVCFRTRSCPLCVCMSFFYEELRMRKIGPKAAAARQTAP